MSTGPEIRIGGVDPEGEGEPRQRFLAEMGAAIPGARLFVAGAAVVVAVVVGGDALSGGGAILPARGR